MFITHKKFLPELSFLEIFLIRKTSIRNRFYPLNKQINSVNLRLFKNLKSINFALDHGIFLINFLCFLILTYILDIFSTLKCLKACIIFVNIFAYSSVKLVSDECFPYLKYFQKTQLG
jgi:hypothetical protein